MSLDLNFFRCEWQLAIHVHQSKAISSLGTKDNKSHEEWPLGGISWLSTGHDLTVVRSSLMPSMESA